MPDHKGRGNNSESPGKDSTTSVERREKKEEEKHHHQQQMLTSLWCPFSLETPFSVLPPCDFADPIPITTKRLQVLSYVLAEISSAAMLLDDYVRVNLHISHRLLAAWQSIAVAAQAKRASRAEKEESPRNCWHSIGSTGSQASHATPEGHHDAPPSKLYQQQKQRQAGRDLLASLRAFRMREETAARHVEFIRRAVVMGLFQQYLDVSVTESMDDLVLRDWIGPGSVHHRRGRGYGRGRRCRRRRRYHLFSQPYPHTQEFNESRFADLTDGEVDDNNSYKDNLKGSSHHGNRNTSNEEGCHNVPCQSHPASASKLSPCMRLMRPTSVIGGDDDDDDDDECARTAVHLQVFIRAAAAFNPTLCALQLMSRCVLRAKHVRNVDDETVIDDEIVNEEEGMFFVVVASRAVGRCEHSEPCFGNRKFFFVRCHSSVFLRRPSSMLDTVWAREGTALITPGPLEAKAELGGTRDVHDTVLESNRLWCRTMQTLAQTLPELHRTNAAVHVRDSAHPLSCVLPSASQLFSNTPRRVRGRAEHTEHLHGAHGDGRGGKEVKRTNTGGRSRIGLPEFKLQQNEEEEEDKRKKHSDEGDDDDEGESHSWFVMHSNRCSATGSFFATAATRVGRLISSSEKSTQEPSLVRHAPCGADDMCVTLDQAIFIPPNAGHDIKYRAATSRRRNTTTRTQTTSAAAAASHSAGAKTRVEPVSMGQLVFLEELIERLTFWSARGEPRRRYYDPTLASGCQTAEVHSATDTMTDESDKIPAAQSTRSRSGILLPLKLLFTQVGTIEFRTIETSMYKNGCGQRLLLLALSESTELVICHTHESRPHCCWHDHGGEDCRGRCNGGVHEDCIRSDRDKDPFSWGCHEDITTEAFVRWAQGEVTRSDEAEFSAAQKSPCSLKRRALSMREQQQLQNERLKVEFRLANSERLDALLLDQRTAKPIASLVLCQMPWGGHRIDRDDQIVQGTSFVVHSFSHYVAGILRHLREEKVLMVDMDRTLVDNAIVPTAPLDSADGSTTNPSQCEGGTFELHCEAWKEICYSSGSASQTIYMETVYLRFGVREMLRRFGVEWGIPLVLVTKSSRQRTEAILRQLLDPEGVLFPLGCGRVYTADSMLRALSEVRSLPTCSAVPSVEEGGAPTYTRQQHQQGLANIMKSISAVLQELEFVSRQRSDLQPSPSRARSVAVLDDAPQVWREADWSHTVLVNPYTLDRIDPKDYFTPDGLITSMLLSTLYSQKSVMCPFPHSARETDKNRISLERSRTGECGVFDMESDTTSFDTASDGDDIDDELCGSLAEFRYPPTPCFGPQGIVDEDVVVVEESPHGSEYNCWATADVEDVTSI